ncbi:MAG: hypothetical protein CL779_03455 [Chloroflexi bacterium]|nr:hypothetical protein [Chloroflexota bacterium]
MKRNGSYEGNLNNKFEKFKRINVKITHKMYISYMIYGLLLIDGVAATSHSHGVLNVNDSCASANNGHCDECGFEPVCSSGTDYTDCDRAPCLKFTVMKDIPFLSADDRGFETSQARGMLLARGTKPPVNHVSKWIKYRELLERGLKSGDVITSSEVNKKSGRVTEVRYGSIWIKVQKADTVYLKPGDSINRENSIVEGFSKNISELEHHEESRSSFFDSILFQGLIAYCSCIFYDRLKKGITFVIDNLRILIDLSTCILMCCMYCVLLFSTVSMVFTAVEDRDKEIEVLKVMGLISFIDYFH